MRSFEAASATRIATAAAKAAASVVVLSGAAAFVSSFGPRPVVLHADVYAPLLRSAGFLAPPAASGRTLREGRVTVNGAPFTYVIGRSDLPLDAVLSHYERQFQLPRSIGPAIRSASRVDGRGAGAVAGVKFGPVDHPGGMSERLAALAESGRLNDFGAFHVISAFEQDGTVFVDFTPAPEVTVQNLIPPQGGDAPGEDVRGVRRPDGLRRLFTVEHGTGGTWSRTLIYGAAAATGSAADSAAADSAAADSVDAASQFSRAFSAAGWKRNPGLSGAVGHYTDGRREAFVAGAGSGPGAIVIVVHRVLARGQGPS